MPIFYIYPPDDFVGGLPREAGSAAQGSGNFELTLTADAQPVLVRVNDNDGIFDEIDAGQTIAHDITLGDTTYSAGDTIHSAYDLINSGSGHQVTSLHLGGSGYEQGAVHGLVSTEPLQPGQTYTFNQERTSHRQENEYDEFVACFAAGTRIATARGAVAVQTLKPGDEILRDAGAPCPLRLLLTRRLSASDLHDRPNLRPVRIAAGALGGGLPQRDLTVSPQHRMLVRSAIATRMFGHDGALIAARKLTELPGITVLPPSAGVSYHHLVLDRHSIIYAEGAPTESFYCGPMALRALPTAARRELRQLFPALQGSPDAARFIPRGRVQKQLVARHRKNNQPLLSAAPL